MPNAETTYADRLQRGWQLHAAITTFTPILAPADVRLLPASFSTFLTSLTGLNQDVAGAEGDWKVQVALRVAMVKDVKARAQRALARVKSHADWKMYLPAVKLAVDNLRGYRAPIPKLPPDVSPAPKPRSPRRDQSYGDIKLLLDKVVAAVARVPGYDATAPEDISSEGLSGLSGQLDELNKLIATKEQALAGAREPRAAAYDKDLPPTLCLHTRMKATKEAVKSQYGSGSPQYLQVKGIKL